MMTAPIHKPMTPREKVAAAIREHIKVDATGLAPAIASAFIVGVDQAADAILAALASGSGDHAELARWIEDYERDAALDAAEDGDLSHVDDGLREFSMAKVKALIAENAALTDALERAGQYQTQFRNRATEAERKLAEARGWIEKLDCECDPAWSTRQCGRCTFLSSTEAERG